MNPFFSNEICPRCHAARLKTWHELTADEQMLLEKLPLSAEFTLAERKKHRFCERCFFEQISFNQSINV